MARPASLITSPTGASEPTLTVTQVKHENLTFWNEHEHIARPQLHGHRVGSAYEAIRAFLSLEAARTEPDFTTRLHNYVDLLMVEMRAYEATRPSSELNPAGSYRVMKKLVVAGLRTQGSGRAGAIEKAIRDGPAEYQVEEEAWPSDMPMGVLRWWRLIDNNVHISVASVRAHEVEDSDVPLADLDADVSVVDSDTPLAELEETARRDESDADADTESRSPPRRTTRSHHPTVVSVLLPKPKRPHGAGRGGRQPTAEHVLLPQTGPAIARSSPRATRGLDGSSAEPDRKRRGARVELHSDEPPTVPNPATTADISAEDQAEFDALFQDEARAYDFRPPRKGGPARVPKGGLKTVDEIIASHCDSSGRVTSTAEVSELYVTPDWYGLQPGGCPFKEPCKTCREKKLDCHYWDRKSCTNCYNSRSKCSEGVLDSDAQVRGQRNPARRYRAIRKLQRCFEGGLWPPVLNEIGEPKAEEDLLPEGKLERGRRKGKNARNGNSVSDAAVVKDEVASLARRSSSSESQEDQLAAPAETAEPAAGEAMEVDGLDAPALSSHGSSRARSNGHQSPVVYPSSPGFAFDELPVQAGNTEATFGRPSNDVPHGPDVSAASPNRAVTASDTYLPPDLQANGAQGAQASRKEGLASAAFQDPPRRDYETVVARLRALEELCREDRAIGAARFDTLHAGLLTINSGVQGTQSVALSAADSARQAADSCARWTMNQDEFFRQHEATRAKPSVLSSMQPPSGSGSVDVESLIHEAVSRTETALAALHREQMDLLKSQVAQDTARMREQAARDTAALQEQASRDAEALRLIVKGHKDRFEARLAAMTISSVHPPRTPSPEVMIRPSAPSVPLDNSVEPSHIHSDRQDGAAVIATAGGATLSTSAQDGSGGEPDVPSMSSSRDPGLRLGTDAGEVGSERDGSPCGASRKRAHSSTVALDEPSEERPPKVARSSFIDPSLLVSDPA